MATWEIDVTASTLGQGITVKGVRTSADGTKRSYVRRGVPVTGQKAVDAQSAIVSDIKAESDKYLEGCAAEATKQAEANAEVTGWAEAIKASLDESEPYEEPLPEKVPVEEVPVDEELV